MLPKQFKPNHLYDLIRLGRNNDGAYLVGKNSVLNANALISFGVHDDCSFEKDFKNLNPANVLCFDYIVDNKFWFKKFRRALRKFFKGEISLIKEFFFNIYNHKKFFNKKNSFFYKKKIVGKKDNNLQSNEINFIENIDLKLIHVHPNNNSNCVNNIPIVLEFSFERNPISVGDNVSFPNYLDQKNNKREDDLSLDFFSDAK